MCSMRCTIHKAHKFAHNCAHKSAQFTKLINICLVCYILGPSSQGYGFFQWSCMDVRVGLWRKLSAKELMLLNCGIGEDSWESLGLQGDPTSTFWRRSALGVLWKEWCWSWNSRTLATHVKSWLIGKDSDAGRDWGQEEKGMTEDEMAGWHHQLDRHEFEWTPGDGDGQGGLACCESWGRRVRHDWATDLTN